MDDLVTETLHRAQIERACDGCEAELLLRPELGMSYQVVNPRLEFAGPAAALRSLWVFAFRPHASSDKHKHSNSTQYTRTWRGSGRMRIGHSELLTDALFEDPARDWMEIPPGVFHQGIAEASGWCVVSFHTVVAEELQDEPFAGVSHHYVGDD